MHKSSVKGPPHTVVSLIEGSQYEFRVFAKNAMGLSEASEMSASIICKEEGGLCAVEFVVDFDMSVVVLCINHVICEVF